MKKISLLFLFFLIARSLPAQQNPQWLRYPAISPDGSTIVFTYHGDIYKVGAAGGEAVPLVIHGAYDFMPVWSHDGRYIAFASDRYGNFDVFIVPVSGGAARRLTWYSGDEFPYDFTAKDEAVLFGTVRMDAPANRQFPSDALQELYKVPVEGGRTRQVLTTTAEDAKVSKDGRYIIYHDRKGRENPWRKHQLSSVTRDIWIYDSVTQSHSLLSSFAGEDRSPVFSANNKDIYYLSERSGSFNIYQQSLSDTNSAKALTNFKQHPVRFLSIANNNTICFGYDGQVYLQQKNEGPKKLPITIITGQKENDEKKVPVTAVQEMAVAPSGKEVAFVFRGDIFVSSVEGNNIKRITTTPEQETSVSFSPDGRKLLYASERNHGWKIYQAELVRPQEALFAASSQVQESALIANSRENYQPAWSPDGKEVAYIEDRTTLKIFNLATRKTRTLLTGDQLVSRRDHDQYFEWSPDGKWLLVQFTEQGSGNEEVGIVNADGNGKLINLTQSGYSDLHPAWMMGGKLITWYSDRQGLHSYANSSTRQQDVYAMFMNARDWENFREEQPGIADTAKHNSIKKAAAGSLIDWQPVRDRKERLTTQASLLMDALVSKDGSFLYYLSKTEKNYDLWRTNLRTRETNIVLRLNVRDGSMKWDREQKYIFLLADGKIIKIDPVNAKQEGINTSTEVMIDLAKERQSMFDHVWRRTAETFYTAGMHGAPWKELKEPYERYLSGIDNNYDFAEMLNELLGELNVSHTGASYNNNRKDGTVTASLGVFYDQAWQGDGVRIAEVITAGPLDLESLDIKAGDIIEAIDGERISKDKDMAQYLEGKSSKHILLRINDGKGVRELLVKPVTPAEEADLLYRRWVKRNQEEVARLSNGTIGYVHLYRMNDAAYRNVYEEAMGKLAACKAIIVDTRFNRGGDLAPELAMFLSGIKVRENANDHFVIGKEPSFRWTKPSIVLANEANYSDGHCFVYDYQVLHMGKLVGMPIPGSCTWMTGQALQDNSLSYSVPTLGVKTLAGRWLENYQTEPDIRVMNEYGIVGKGRDQQLERAVEELMNDLKKNR
ncbi:peptidase S41 [Paraflavitalea soli]|uniref:Tricorn protease homolog n=1 Tax=Paraflavitalea soli TaxID=2315862 RepID=A0A3B7MEW9_9BACT|nr:S41 family peptidase [Paraflavitalea soli]AXY72852.1 peptidase S41 [Paraflavitalea soli]